jgi:hypothetical protein
MAKKEDQGPVWCTMHDEAAEKCQPKGHGVDQLPKTWLTKGNGK